MKILCPNCNEVIFREENLCEVEGGFAYYCDECGEYIDFPLEIIDGNRHIFYYNDLDNIYSGFEIEEI